MDTLLTQKGGFSFAPKPNSARRKKKPPGGSPPERRIKQPSAAHGHALFFQRMLALIHRLIGALEHIAEGIVLPRDEIGAAEGNDDPPFFQVFILSQI